MSHWKRKPKIVYVEWEDSCTTYGWLNPQVDETSMIRSVGIEVARTKKSITISTSESQGGRHVDPISIPMGCIRKIKRIADG